MAGKICESMWGTAMGSIAATILASVLAVTLPLAPAAAQSPAALVEEIRGNPQGIQEMDYVVAGQIIKLGAGEGIVLGYLNSCIRESIAGGTVTVGREQSNVKAGTVERDKMPCQGGRTQLTVQQANQSAAMVFRGPPGRSKAGAAKPQLTLYSTAPIIDANGGGSLSVTRVDRDGERIELSLTVGHLVRGTFYDFLLANQRLTAGGVYRATFNGRSIVFKVDEHAGPGPTAVVSRLLRFPAGRQ